MGSVSYARRLALGITWISAGEAATPSDPPPGLDSRRGHQGPTGSDFGPYPYAHFPGPPAQRGRPRKGLAATPGPSRVRFVRGKFLAAPPPPRQAGRVAFPTGQAPPLRRGR